tara:strand:- start:2948 stop:3874 length:927 start_codon:yes stop_codon:yes gene_type:complete
MNLKKPKFWDYKKPNLYAYLLSPIALLIKIINTFNKKTQKKKFKIKTICIGNFYVGGTGKTSLSIKINKILNDKKIKSCFVKKYYKNQIDEQKILKSNGKLFISRSRVQSLKEAEEQNYDIAILDDGVQDKSIDCDLIFICFNNINWIGNGMTIPAGPLRESIKNLKNYNHVFLNGNLENVEKLTNEILYINPNINIHLGRYEPTNINDFNKDNNYLVFSGIGNHNTFVSMIKKYGLNVLKDIEYPDHYKYVDKDIDNILSIANNLNCEIITTEKDYNRIDKLNTSKIKILRCELSIVDEDHLIKFII